MYKISLHKKNKNEYTMLNPNLKFPKIHTSLELENKMPLFRDCHEYLKDYVPFDGDKLFVAGGFFVRKLIGAPINDIDVFVNDNEYFKFLEEEYTNLGYEKYTKSDDYVEKKDNHYHTRFLHKEDDVHIDLINFHDPRSIEAVGNFDLNICQIAMDETGLYFYDTPDAIIEYMYKKEMYLVGPVKRKTFSRILKYSRMGFTLIDDDIALSQLTLQP